MRARGLGSLLAVAAIATGCGEQRFDADEFIERANANGAGLVLGEPLLSERDGVEIYAVELLPTSATGEVAPTGGEAHGGGSLIVAEDAEAGQSEYARCEGAVTLVCYRAANVVLAVEGEPGSAELVGVDGAIRALASD